MKTRNKGFLKDELISHKSEQFDYITELHDYLWKFIRSELPGASGNIRDYIDIALQQSENRALINKQLYRDILAASILFCSCDNPKQKASTVGVNNKCSNCGKEIE